MNIDRKVLWAVPCLAALALGLAIGMRQKLSNPMGKDETLVPIVETTQVVALYDGRPTRPAATDPMGVHVADVGIGPKGARLLGAPDQALSDSLKAALAELVARPFLPAMGDGGEGGGTTLGVSETKPGDEQYAWAVGGFLRERTGLKYDVRPYVKPKAP